jgi:hypothetical protein
MVYVGDIRHGYRVLNRLIDPGMSRLTAVWHAAMRQGYATGVRLGHHTRYPVGF